MPDEGTEAKDSREAIVNVSDGGDAFLKLVEASGVQYIFFNPGSDYYPILEHMSEIDLKSEELSTTKLVLCLSEKLALTMAHGFSMLTQKAQVVMVHVGLGTLELGGALHNVYRDRAPVLIVAGRAPHTTSGELLGGRDRPYHWDQELYDQPGLVREFAKWTYELKTNSNLHLVLSRAFQMANAEPQGPVYLIIPRELLAEKINAVKTSAKGNWEPPAPPRGNLETLEKIGDILIQANSPIILTEYLGRNSRAVHSLVELSELVGSPVVEPSRKRMNFPTDHPLYLSGFPNDLLEKSDAILILDADVPWAPAIHKIRSDAKILQIDSDPLKRGFPLWGFPIDLATSGSTDTDLPELVRIIRDKIASRKDIAERIRERSKEIAGKHVEIKKKLASVADMGSNSTPMKVESLLFSLNKLRYEHTIVISEGVSNEQLIQSYFDCLGPNTYFSSGGSNLGEGLGIALGIKLSSPNSEVLSIIGDGGFIYSNPTAVFWTAVKYKIGILSVIINNGGYKAMKNAVERGYPRGNSAMNDHFSGSRINPSPDYVEIVKACGGSGWKVEKLSELEKAVSMARLEITKGIPCVVDALVERV